MGGGPAIIARNTRQGKYGPEGPTPTHLPPIGGEQELRIALTGIEKAWRELATTRILGDQRPGKLPARLGVEAQLHAALCRCAQLPSQTDRRAVRADRRPSRERPDRTLPAHVSAHDVSCDQLRERAPSLPEIKDIAANHGQPRRHARGNHRRGGRRRPQGLAGTSVEPDNPKPAAVRDIEDE